MQRKLLTAMVTALALSLSGASHALLIWLPDGTKREAQIVGNRLMVRDASGNMASARDGVYKTDDGRALVVKGGIIATPGGAKEPSDAGNKGQAVGPMYNSPSPANAPAGGTSPVAPAPTGPTPNVPDAKFVKCPLAQARTEVVSKLPKGWWQTPYEGPLVGTRVEMIGGEKTLVCEYQAYTTRASVMTKVPVSANCVAVATGFNCR